MVMKARGLGGIAVLLLAVARERDEQGAGGARQGADLAGQVVAEAEVGAMISDA